MAQAAYRTPPEDQGVTGRTDHLEIDWPRSLGFFGALGAAVALDLVPVPIAAFVAAVPFLKLINRPNASRPERFISHLVDGAAKPVGGDAEGTVRWAPGEIKAMARSRSRRARKASTHRRGEGRK
ncbi:MAG TPA: hypothetical protein VNA65_06325 [Candidatus Dormibacteraeota bacterium]|nr:hypothetical protein [Candidatus Dormibacteraeota bacterium]